ncbi:wiskott-Aldrich syndrome protein homolog [Schistocerca cancellata]|uniref:wiskott-Aldrich syndrome protein homolog n=1 Tax=Schistocerca cancellata TaxID=274614 RepID=UPI0021179CDB|nr:wiskott-Aldrich syndrome protein homolog [Schistocerca cancellata]
MCLVGLVSQLQGGALPAGAPVPVSGGAQRAELRRATAGPPWRPPTTDGGARARACRRRPSARGAAASAHARASPRARVDGERSGPRPPPTPRRWSMVLRDVAARRSARAAGADAPLPPPPPPPPPAPATPPGGAICEVSSSTRARAQHLFPGRVSRDGRLLRP